MAPRAAGTDSPRSRRGREKHEQQRQQYWSQDVTRTSNALDLEPGVFTWDDPAQIAQSLKRSAETSTRRKGTPLQSAMSMLNFYINRAGRGLPDERRRVLERAKAELRHAFHALEASSTFLPLALGLALPYLPTRHAPRKLDPSVRRRRFRSRSRLIRFDDGQTSRSARLHVRTPPPLIEDLVMAHYEMGSDGRPSLPISAALTVPSALPPDRRNLWSRRPFFWPRRRNFHSFSTGRNS